MADYQVKGTLTLDTRKFDEAVGKAKTELTTFVNQFKQLNNAGTQLTQLQTRFDNLEKELTESRRDVSSLNKELERLQTSANGTGTSFSNSSNSIGRARNSLNSYNTSANAARASNTNLSSSFGLASKSASNFSTSLSNTNRLLRTLKTTGSIIFGMYAYQFVDALGQSAGATIKAKSEMESYYKALNMGSIQQRQFSNMLDRTLKLYPKMNKYQLGETLSSLGVEFDLNLQQMEKIGKVAPMIINEYLRAGRSTEEAILAIKDISQGEFLRLSRETGVGKEEIKDAGWSGDLKDIEGLYEALEKVGKSRNWDQIAQKATSLNDVMLISENRFGEFATDLVSRITPSVVNSFNAMIDVMNWLQTSWDSLGAGGQLAAMLTGGLLGIGTAVNKLYGIMSNFITIRAANMMGINAEIAAEEGLARAYAETMFAAEMEAKAKEFNITSTFEETVATQQAAAAKSEAALAEENYLMQKTASILKGNEEISITEAIAMAESELIAAREAEAAAMEHQLAIREALIEAGLIEGDTVTVTDAEISANTFARELNVDAITAQKLALEAEAMAMETGISIEEARVAVLNKEKIANMGAGKTIATKILKLNAETVANNGLRVALASKLRLLDVERVREIASAVATGEKTAADYLGADGLIAKSIAAKIAAGAEEEEAAAAVMAEAATLTLAATIGILVGVVAALALVVAPLIIDFNNMSASFDKVANTLSDGSEKIEELKTKQEAYQNTIDDLSNKTNLNAQETDKLKEARDGLKYTTNALKAAEEEYAYAQLVQQTYTNYSTEIEGKRYENLKKINAELNKASGTKGVQYTDNTYGMGTAYKESYKMLQIMNYEEDHRIERNKQLEDSIKRQNLSQEETKRLIQEYGKEWNQVYTDREIAQARMADPELSGFDKLSAYWDNWWASAKLSWIEFWANPWEGTFKEPPNLEEMLTPLVDGLFGEGAMIDISKLLSYDETSIQTICDGLWLAIDNYLTNHVPMYGWLKGLLPNEEAEEHGQEAGSNVVSGVQTGIAPIDAVINSGLGGVNGLLSRFGIQWGNTSKTSGGKIKSGTKSGSNGTDAAVSSNLNPIQGLLKQFGIKWGSSANAGGGKIKTGVQTGSKGASGPVKNEVSDITKSLNGASGTWWSAAFNSAKGIVGAIAAGLNRHSPGDAAKTIEQEMIDSAMFINERAPDLYNAAYATGGEIIRGFQSVNLDNTLNSAFNNMAANSNNVVGMNQATLTDTTSTYNSLGSLVNTTFTGINNDIAASEVGVTSSLNQMNANVKGNFDSMRLNTETTMKDTATSNQKNMNLMASSTLSTTRNMVSAWNSMRTNIVSAANYIRTQSYNKFQSLHKSIASFYNQLASAKFSAGALPAGSSSLSRGRRLRVGRLSGNTGGRIRTKEPVYGTKGSFKEAHYNRIMNTAYPWKIGDPWFLGIQIPMNNHVRDFKNGGNNVRVNSGNFEEILRMVLTARGFANPSTYEYYANSKRSNQQVWDQVRCNCYDGAEMIVEIGQMLGLSGHLVHGSWKGEGHMGAVVGGKLYDMTQFQKRGVFRGTSGVSFGTSGRGGAGSNNYNNKTTNLNVNVDLSNARIYGIDDLDNHIKRATEETYYELHSPDGAVGF